MHPLSHSHSHTVTHAEIAGGCSHMPVLFPTTGCPPPYCGLDWSDLLWIFFFFLIPLPTLINFEIVIWVCILIEIEFRDVWEKEKIWNDFVVSRCKYWVKKNDINKIKKKWRGEEEEEEEEEDFYLQQHGEDCSSTERLVL